MARPNREQVVVLTGASSGVGRACARVFASHGAKVGLIARNVEALEAAAQEVRNLGGEALVLPADVADAAAIEEAAAAVEARWGRIDVWCNNAMATVFARVMDITPEEFRRVTEVTYLGYVYGTQAALRRMLPRDEGTIIQIGSALAFRSIPLQSAYCAGKAAIRGFTDSLRSELIRDGSHVRLTAVHLPAVNTPQPLRQRNKMPRQQQPVPPLFSPESVAEAIVWAAEHSPRTMLVGQPTVRAVWGQKFIPGFLDDYLSRAAWDPQFVDEPNTREDDILFHPVPGDPGAHGPYTDRERGPDLQMRLRMRPRAVAAGASLSALALLGLAGGLVARWRS
jgi:NAD(P)-dependent dehydrogenase (short-subunit alcohol dehydrogenase family)